MSILWIYDKPIDPKAGGTEKVTNVIGAELENLGYGAFRWLAIEQTEPRTIRDNHGNTVEDLASYLRDNKIKSVVNQIGYSDWLLREFLARGGAKWRQDGGHIVSSLHFDPRMFRETVGMLARGWRQKSIVGKVKRSLRILALPINDAIARSKLTKSYIFLLASSDLFILLSRKHKREFSRLSKNRYPDRVRFVPNPNIYSAQRCRVPLSQKEKTVLLVSRLDENQKRVSISLRAWSMLMSNPHLRDWHLKIVGEGADAKDYHALVAKKSIRNVQFVGKANPERFYDEASIYLHTAKREGWGLTITEAMQKKVVPVVMNNSPVFSDFINDGESGFLVDNNRLKHFVDKIELLMIRPKLREQMANAASKSSADFSAERVAKSWARILRL